MLTLEVVLLLVAIALFAGIGITAIGPGGVFVTIALFVLVPISSATVAGTASATFVATGILGTLIYHRSGEFTHGRVREMAILLAGASGIGAIVGAWINIATPDRLFAIVLGTFVFAIGVLVLYRELVGIEPADHFAHRSVTSRRLLIVGMGIGIGFLGGMLGVGGPVIAVPILVALGVPMLFALAISQVQSVVISGVATIGYASVGAISWPLVLLVGIPQLVGVLVGWRIAHRVDPRRLRIALGLVLIGIGPFLAI